MVEPGQWIRHGEGDHHDNPASGHHKSGILTQTLASVKNRLQRLEGIFEHFSDLERSTNSLHTELIMLSEKLRMMEEKTKEFDKGMEFEKAEIEGLKKKDKENEDKIKELEDK